MRIFLLSLLLATLGNADVLKLVKAGLSVETIEAKISASATDFDTSTDALVSLANAGVPDRVIRAMIEQQDAAAVPPVPPVPPVAPIPPAPPRAISRRYDVTIHAAQGGGKCDAEVRIDGKGIRASRCKTLDFDLRWNEVANVCYRYGFRGELVLRTRDGERRLSTTTPAEAKKLVEHIHDTAPKLPVAECR
ncbi:MAG: hypothetical protein ACJ74H_12575 [Thermoanaerobaculia bacterium]